jgi:aspartate/methionine/tyrosine aminotransferase
MREVMVKEFAVVHNRGILRECHSRFPLREVVWVITYFHLICEKSLQDLWHFSKLVSRLRLQSLSMFENRSVNIPLLRTHAFNLRWATLPTGTIPLTAADPDFPIAPAIQEAITRFTADGYFSYNDPKGYAPFKEALSGKYKTTHQANYSPDCILPVDSAAAGLELVCRTYLKPGDEAIIFDPVDFLFRHSIESVGATAITFAIAPFTDEVDFSGIEELISPETKLICLCNPLNPTGKVFTRKEFSCLVEIAIRKNIIILSDEIWSDIIFDNHIHTAIASIDDAVFQQTITVTGFSKSYGLAGLRIGAILAPNLHHFKNCTNNQVIQQL